MSARGTEGRRRVFVYGSLLSGERHHDLLEGSLPLGDGRTTAPWVLVDLGEYPGLLRRAAQSRSVDAWTGFGVRGEIYAVDAETLSRLDALEEHPTLYRRESLALADGSSAEAYVWLAPLDSGCVVIPSGDWRAHRATRGAR